MKLSLAGLKVHLAHCTSIPRIGRYFGLTFTPTGVPGIASVPRAH